MNSLAIRVALADDHPVIRLGVRSALDEAPAIQCIGAVADSTELVALLERESCDVLVTDYAMPGGAFGDGLELLGYLAHHFPALRVVVMTGLDQPGLIHKLDASGAAGIVSKSDDLSQVQAAVMAQEADRQHAEGQRHAQAGRRARCRAVLVCRRPGTEGRQSAALSG